MQIAENQPRTPCSNEMLVIHLEQGFFCIQFFSAVIGTTNTPSGLR